MEQKQDSNISSSATIENCRATNKSKELIQTAEERLTCLGDEYDELIQNLEKQPSWEGRHLLKYENFWYPMWIIRPILRCRQHFKADDTDIILATMPKSGTTWLKALTFSIVNRNIYTIDQSPLLASNPHRLVPILEYELYWKDENPDLQQFPSPRIFSTHVPLSILPESILESGCKIIYICRNPFDQFISHRHFFIKNFIREDVMMHELAEAVNMFCKGIYSYGPFWEHMLQYWNLHLKNPGKILFLQYEDLKEDITSCVRKIAEFLGLPFSVEEERKGLVEQISSLCSFENLSNLEINKGSVERHMVKNSSYFRKGEVGDWKNYLTPTMAEQIKKVMESKFEGSGLTFKTSN